MSDFITPEVMASISAFLVALFSWFTWLLKKRKRNQVKKCNDLSLLDHPLFRQLDCMKKKVIHGFFVDREKVNEAQLKEYAFRDLMVNKIDIWKDELYKLALAVDGFTEFSESYEIHLKTFHEGMDRYTTYYLNQMYSDLEKETMKIIMAKFNDLHRKNTDMVKSAVEGFHGLSMFSISLYEANSHIFSTYQLAFMRMYNDVESSIVSLNGSLKGLKFRKRYYL